MAARPPFKRKELLRPIRKHDTPVDHIPPKKVDRATIMRLKPPEKVEPRIGIPPQVNPIKFKSAPARSPTLKRNIKKR